MQYDRINAIYQLGLKLKQQAIDKVSEFKYYNKASKEFKRAMRELAKLTPVKIAGVMQKDIFLALYTYEYYDCCFSYLIKIKRYEKAIEIGKLQEAMLNLIIQKYPSNTTFPENTKFVYDRLFYFQNVSRFQLNFQIAQQYFNEKSFYKALRHFRIAKERLLSSEHIDLASKGQLEVQNRNTYILETNIVSCLMGISLTDSGSPRKFLIVFVVNQLIQCIAFADKLIDLTNDNYYGEGKVLHTKNLRKVLADNQEFWEELLIENGRNDLVCRLCQEIDQELFFASVPALGNPDKLEYRILFSVHGFNTRGEWKNNLTTVISADEHCSTVRFIQVPWDYGVFKLIKFLTPMFRRKVYADFARKYENILSIYGDRVSSTCLVAHSFGTRITSFSMLTDAGIKFERIVYAGSILRRDFNWDVLKNNGQCDKVLFEVNSNDRALLLAGLLSKIPKVSWIGNAGKKGFKNAYSYVDMRYDTGDHSDMLNVEVFKKRWLPFLKS